MVLFELRIILKDKCVFLVLEIYFLFLKFWNEIFIVIFIKYLYYF